MDPTDLLMTALRATIVYFFLLVVIRLLGKRAVGVAGAFDLLVALMLGEVVDEAIFGDVSMPKALLAISVIAVWHFVNEWLSYRSKKVDELTSGTPSVVMENGEMCLDALAKERINPNEVLSQMRLKGIEDPKEVKTATLEPSGQMSFLYTQKAKPLQKSDLGKNGGKG